MAVGRAICVQMAGLMRYTEFVKRACVVGSSDGIGLATSARLLAEGWSVIGVSRSPSAMQHPHYTHFCCDVTTPEYRALLQRLSRQAFDAIIYCVGTGERLSLDALAREVHVFEVNLMAALTTTEIMLPPMLSARQGHLVVLSSLADVLVSHEYPSYNASKAALSSYFSGLASALRNTGVAVSHIRFGFVDTKLAKSRFRPFMVTREVAAGVVVGTLRRGSRRISFPLRMAWLVAVLRVVQSFGRMLSS